MITIGEDAAIGDLFEQTYGKIINDWDGQCPVALSWTPTAVAASGWLADPDAVSPWAQGAVMADAWADTTNSTSSWFDQDRTKPNTKGC